MDSGERESATGGQRVEEKGAGKGGEGGGGEAKGSGGDGWGGKAKITENKQIYFMDGII